MQKKVNEKGRQLVKSRMKLGAVPSAECTATPPSLHSLLTNTALLQAIACHTIPYHTILYRTVPYFAGVGWNINLERMVHLRQYRLD